MFRALLIVVGVWILSACEEPPAKSPEHSEQTSVPANSISDARMRGEEDPKDRQEREVASAQDKKDDPTEPYTTKVGAAPAGSPSKNDGRGGATAGKGAVSRTECDRVMDRYLELEIATNPQLKGVPPEVIDQAKQMAREKHGDSPCTATRAQYTCAMAASSTAAWQRCMK